MYSNWLLYMYEMVVDWTLTGQLYALGQEEIFTEVHAFMCWIAAHKMKTCVAILMSFRWWIRLKIPWWCHQMEAFSALLALCARNSLVTGEFPAQRPVTQSFDVFFDLCLNQELSKQWWRRWFETPSCSLSNHCNIPLSKMRTYLVYVLCVIYVPGDHHVTHLTKSSCSIISILQTPTFCYLAQSTQHCFILFYFLLPCYVQNFKKLG